MAIGIADYFIKDNDGVNPDGQVMFNYNNEAEARKEVRAAFVNVFGVKPARVERKVAGMGVRFLAVGKQDDLYRRHEVMFWV